MLSCTHVLIVFLLFAWVESAASTRRDSHQALKQKLFDMASAQQSQEDKPYIPLLQWMEHKGVYKSSIKLNFHGNPLMAEARRLMDIFDNNMFATAWVTSSLLEAFRYNPKTRPSIQQLDMALEVIHRRRNMNVQHNTSTFAFWQQEYNKTASYWSSTPANLISAYKLLDDLPLTTIISMLKALGLESYAHTLEMIKRMEYWYLSAFHIPPDFDDTFVNLGLGALLSDVKEDFPSTWAKWSTDNTNLTSALDSLKKYAYRPFSKDPNVNSIDTRTYYYLRGFLDQAYVDGHDIALVTTWLQNIGELRTEFYKGVRTPLQDNNVDITVAANTIFGLTSSVLSGVLSPSIFDDEDIAQIYLNTSSLIAYMINNNITDRPDLALTYYPSQIEFDWFVSRTTAEMDSYLIGARLPHPVMDEVHSMLISALNGKMTSFTLAKAKKDNQGSTYFDDFIGNGDTTFDNKPLNRAEDRIFTTAMAVNALLYTWSIFTKENSTCAWKTDVPQDVKSIVNSSVQWLADHTLDKQYKPWNAFFSGSNHGITTISYAYPANLYEHLNGTKILDWNRFPRPDDRLAMSGYVPKAEYDAMISQKHFGMSTPIVFNGYNEDTGKYLPPGFPFWTSDAYTYSTTLVALARFDCVHG